MPSPSTSPRPGPPNAAELLEPLITTGFFDNVDVSAAVTPGCYPTVLVTSGVPDELGSSYNYGLQSPMVIIDDGKNSEDMIYPAANGETDLSNLLQNLFGRNETFLARKSDVHHHNVRHGDRPNLFSADQVAKIISETPDEAQSRESRFVFLPKYMAKNDEPNFARIQLQAPAILRKLSLSRYLDSPNIREDRLHGLQAFQPGTLTRWEYNEGGRFQFLRPLRGVLYVAYVMNPMREDFQYVEDQQGDAPMSYVWDRWEEEGRLGKVLLNSKRTFYLPGNCLRTIYSPGGALVFCGDAVIPYHLWSNVMSYTMASNSEQLAQTTDKPPSSLHKTYKPLLEEIVGGFRAIEYGYRQLHFSERSDDQQRFLFHNQRILQRFLVARKNDIDRSSLESIKKICHSIMMSAKPDDKRLVNLTAHEGTFFYDHEDEFTRGFVQRVDNAGFEQVQRSVGQGLAYEPRLVAKLGDVDFAPDSCPLQIFDDESLPILILKVGQDAYNVTVADAIERGTAIGEMAGVRMSQSELKAHAGDNGIHGCVHEFMDPASSKELCGTRIHERHYVVCSKVGNISLWIREDDNYNCILQKRRIGSFIVLCIVACRDIESGEPLLLPPSSLQPMSGRRRNLNGSHTVQRIFSDYSSPSDAEMNVQQQIPQVDPNFYIDVQLQTINDFLSRVLEERPRVEPLKLVFPGSSRTESTRKSPETEEPVANLPSPPPTSTILRTFLVTIPPDDPPPRRQRTSRPPGSNPKPKTPRKSSGTTGPCPQSTTPSSQTNFPTENSPQTPNSVRRTRMRATEPSPQTTTCPPVSTPQQVSEEESSDDDDNVPGPSPSSRKKFVPNVIYSDSDESEEEAEPFIESLPGYIPVTRDVTCPPMDLKKGTKSISIDHFLNDVEESKIVVNNVRRDRRTLRIVKKEMLFNTSTIPWRYHTQTEYIAFNASLCTFFGFTEDDECGFICIPCSMAKNKEGKYGHYNPMTLHARRHHYNTHHNVNTFTCKWHSCGKQLPNLKAWEDHMHDTTWGAHASYLKTQAGKNWAKSKNLI